MRQAWLLAWSLAGALVLALLAALVAGAVYGAEAARQTAIVLAPLGVTPAIADGSGEDTPKHQSRGQQCAVGGGGRDGGLNRRLQFAGLVRVTQQVARGLGAKRRRQQCE